LQIPYRGFTNFSRTFSLYGAGEESCVFVVGEFDLGPFSQRSLDAGAEPSVGVMNYELERRFPEAKK